ncbi:winged helix DNA-binding domain-containing protein [Nonomuraea sp. NBC_01738]|uniref:winged helix DNA-binding domain-containing protein n=1 Tax=Nonomuraea sp. NBC_01738 TaxID=2976003 RepID=UPI002E12E6F6|nr:winged helix DNA-binding domain-containing protein [Nonomuraea sp. NBC_01738]
MNELTWSQVSARRLARQGLAGGLSSPAEVAAAQCGTHAQIMSAAELSIALRVPGATRQTVRQALWEDGTLVKTYGPRGTVHLLATADLPAWVGAMGTIPLTLPPFCTLEQAERVIAALGAVLAGRELTIDEVTEALADEAGPWAAEKVMPAFQDMWPRWRAVTHFAGHRGALCFGRDKGRKVTLTAPLPFVPDPAGPQTLARHYLHAYGPATPQRFARWAGASVRWASEAFGLLELEEVAFGGERAWVLKGDTDFPGEPGTRAEGTLLLPYFDAYAIAAQPRELLYAGRAWERALSRGQAGNFPVVLVDGVVKGVWHQRRTGKKIAIRVEMFDGGEPAGLAEQARRVGEILEGTPELTLGEVTVGAHA